MEQIVCSETSAIINQTPGNHPKEDILYSKRCVTLPEIIHAAHVAARDPSSDGSCVC
jgi:hypothetical protein